MLSTAALLGFCLAVTPLVITPGASFTLVSARGMAGDRRGSWAVITGTAAGVVTHAVFAGVGLAAVVMRSAELYHLLRLVGAAYLIGLGVTLLWRSRGSTPLEPKGDTGAPSTAMVHLYRAYVANVLNVKAASVYLTLGPQFVPAESVGVGSMLLLAAVHVTVMVAWLGIWSTGLAAIASRLSIQTWTRRIDRVGGLLLVALGARTAAQSR